MTDVLKIPCPQCGQLLQPPPERQQYAVCPNCQSILASTGTTSTPAPRHATSDPASSGDSGTATRPSSGIATLEEQEVPAEWRVGDVYLNLYEVKRILGQGGMGKVYQVHHRRWGIDLAVKCPRPSIVKMAGGVAKFEAECETWIKMAPHPNTVNCFYVRRLGGMPRIFAEYIEGRNLMDCIDQGLLYDDGADVALDRILKIAIQSAWGLLHAHNEGFVHRDVKPSNILLTREGNAKVTDFGLAKTLESLTSDGNISALDLSGMTPLFCSPEQVAKKNITQRTDLWSWAASVFQMFSVKVTWTYGTEVGKALHHFLRDSATPPNVPALPKRLALLLAECFHKDPAHRPQSFEPVTAELVAIYEECTGAPFPFHPPARLEARAERLNNRAVSYLDMDKESEAREAWQHALKASPKHTESTFNYLSHLWRRGEITDDILIEQLRQSAKAHSDPAMAHFLTALIHIERGDLRKAKHILDQIDTISGADETLQASKKLVNEQQKLARALFRIDEGHADAIRTIDLCPHGRYVASAGEDNSVRLWRTGDGSVAHILGAHRGTVLYVRFDPKGETLVTAGLDRNVFFWELESGLQKGQLRLEERNATALSYSFATSSVLAGLDNGQILVRSLMETNGKCHALHRAPVTCLALAEDGIQCISAAAGEVLVWDTSTGHVYHNLTGHHDTVNAVAIHLGAGLAATGSTSGTIRLWDLETGECRHRLRDERGAIHTLAFTKDGATLLSGGDSRLLRLWQTGTGKCLSSLEGHNGKILCTVPTRDGAFAVSGGDEHKLFIWNIRAGESYTVAPLMLCRAVNVETLQNEDEQLRRAIAHAQTLFGQQKYHESARITQALRAQSTAQRRADVLDLWFRLYAHLPKRALASCWEGPHFQGHQASIRAIALSAHGSYGVSTAEDTEVLLWEMNTGKILRQMRGHPSPGTGVQISPDARRAVSTCEGGAIQVWDLAAGVCTKTLEVSGGSVEGVAVSPDCRFAITAGWSINFWDLEAGVCLRSIESPQEGLCSIAWSPCGRYFVTGGYDQIIRIWDVASGACKASLKGHHAAIQTLALSLDGATLASGAGNPWGSSAELFLWSLQTGKPIKVLEGHRKPVSATAFTPDARFLFTGSLDGTCRLWDCASGQCLHVFAEQAAAISALAVSPDARFVATGAADGSLATWVLDWQLSTPDLKMSGPLATRILETFNYRFRPYAGAVPGAGKISQASVEKAFTKTSRPSWTPEEMNYVLYMLGCAGCGHLSPEDVEKQLKGRSTWLGKSH
ncbi:MAG: protein kinase [Candidatus Hydrogenedentes bacterium]|nr:protein kinase [Candidatus Hydrogenedentota bacterium]